MATKMSTIARTCSKTRFLNVFKPKSNPNQPQIRCLSERSTSIPGPIPAEPLRKQFSIPLVIGCITVGVYVGQYVAKTFAAFMEETELFVPDDDDD